MDRLSNGILTPVMAAALLGKTPTTIRNWCRTGKLPHKLTPGGEYLIAESVIRKFVPRGSVPIETDAQRRRRVEAAMEAIRNL